MAKNCDVWISDLRRSSLAGFYCTCFFYILLLNGSWNYALKFLLTFLLLVLNFKTGDECWTPSRILPDFDQEKVLWKNASLCLLNSQIRYLDKPFISWGVYWCMLGVLGCARHVRWGVCVKYWTVLDQVLLQPLTWWCKEWRQTGANIRKWECLFWVFFYTVEIVLSKM